MTSKRRYSHDIPSLDVKLFSLKLVPDIVEVEYSRQEYKSYHKTNVRVLQWTSTLIFPIFALIGYFYHEPGDVNEVLIHILASILYFGIIAYEQVKQPHSSNSNVFLVCMTWIVTGFVGRRYYGPESFFVLVCAMYSLTGTSLMAKNIMVFMGVVLQLYFDYNEGRFQHIGIWSISLFAAYLWSWLGTHILESISRKCFLLSKTKMTEQRRLAARQNCRMMYELVPVKGTHSVRIRRRDMLSSKYLGEDTDSRSDTSSSTTASLDDESVFNESMDKWAQQSFPDIKWLLSYAISVSLLLSLLNWVLLPRAAAKSLAIRHFSLFVPFCVNVLLFIFSTEWINSYSKLKLVLAIMLLVSVSSSWGDLMQGLKYDKDGELRNLCVANFHLLLFVRNSFPFLPRVYRVITVVADISFYSLICLSFPKELNRFTPYLLFYMIIVPLLTEIQMSKIWRHIIDIYAHIKQLDFLMNEIEKEIGAMHDLKGVYERYQIENLETPSEVNSLLKPVGKSERWTPMLQNEDIEVLRDIFIQYLDDIGLVASLRFEMKTLSFRVAQVLHLYKENPFHNARHAISTCFVLKYFLVEGGAKKYFTDLEVLAIMLAGLSHDVGHPGRTNSFLIRTNSELVELYGTSSTLEHYHVETALDVLGELPFLPYLEEYKKAWMRNLMSKMILATDTASFGKVLSEFNSYIYKIKSFKSSGDSHAKAIVSSMILCCADIAYISFETEETAKWFTKYLNELYLQGDEEERLGLGVSLFMNRHRNTPYTLFYGFIDQIGCEMVKYLAELLDIKDFVNQMENNKLLFGLRRKGEEL